MAIIDDDPAWTLCVIGRRDRDNLLVSVAVEIGQSGDSPAAIEVAKGIMLDSADELPHFFPVAVQQHQMRVATICP